MNIFILDSDLNSSVCYHPDKHVVKMPLELAQMLSTAHHVLDGDLASTQLYKKTHVNHPCSKWIRETKGNYLYGYNLFKQLCQEYTFRYNKCHLSWIKLHKILANPPKNIRDDTTITPFALAMPETYKNFNDPVQSYRQYFLGEKTHIFSWKNRPTPYWVT
jgi:hypothetical protein